MTDKNVKTIALFGIGALGGNIAESITRQNISTNLIIIDKDIVEARNIPTQPYNEVDVGKLKVKVLAEKLYRINKTNVIAIKEEVTEFNLNSFKKQVKNCDLIIDCFDNPPSRKLIQKLARDNSKNCIHAGIMENYGEVIWDENYKIPELVGQNPCNNPNARELVHIITALTTRATRVFLDKGLKNNYSITMEDIKVDKWSI